MHRALWLLARLFAWSAKGGRAIMLAGGVEAPLAPLIFGAFDVIHAISGNSNDEPEIASRPFDAHRDGFVMSEGASILVLEDMEHARARGAKIYAEILGYATTTDAFHMTAPRPDGAQVIRCMREALADVEPPTSRDRAHERTCLGHAPQ